MTEWIEIVKIITVALVAVFVMLGMVFFLVETFNNRAYNACIEMGIDKQECWISTHTYVR
jgi:LPS O-antigen subunit length determinant protein (WzzB/FepE family)